MTVEIQEEEVKVQEEEEELEQWTTDYLKYELKKHLATIPISASHKTDLLDWYPPNSRHDNKVIDFRKYYNQAYHYLKIGRLRPVPKFLISIAELNPRLVTELSRYDRQDRNYLLKQAIALIFQEINQDLYHKSIAPLLEVQLID